MPSSLLDPCTTTSLVAGEWVPDCKGFVFNPINIGTYDFWKLSRKA